MIEKTSLDVTGETFLCPYCQTWLELPLSLKAKHLAELVGWKRAHDDVAAENHRICQTLDKLRIKHLAVMLEKNEEIAALLKGRKSIIQFMKTEYEKELAKKNKELATLKKEESMPAPERFLSDEGMNVYDAAIKVIGELKAEIAKRNTEIATLTEKYLRAGAIAERFKEVT